MVCIFFFFLKMSVRKTNRFYVPFLSYIQFTVVLFLFSLFLIYNNYSSYHYYCITSSLIRMNAVVIIHFLFIDLGLLFVIQRKEQEIQLLSNNSLSFVNRMRNLFVLIIQYCSSCYFIHEHVSREFHFPSS